MKKPLLTLFLFISVVSLGQTFVPALPNPEFEFPVLDSCDQDTSVMIQQFDDWTVYHTQDDLWSGDVDSNFCFNYADPSTTGLVLDYDETDAGRPLTVKCLIDSAEEYQFINDWIYTVRVDIQTEDIDLDWSCTDCNKMILGIRTPNSTGTGDTIKYFEYIPEITNEWSGVYYSLNFCFATEKFVDTNHLAEFYLHLNLLDSGEPEKVVRIKEVFFGDPNDEVETAPLNDGTITSLYSGSNEYYLPSWYGNYLVQYDTTSYPSAADIYHLDFGPIPNVPDSQAITIYLEYGGSLVFQPFTNIRGELVDGGSIRHSVSLINEGTHLCTHAGGGWEIKFSGNDRYVHKAGHIELHKGNCMLFKDGARLVIDQDATLRYGNKGLGMLALFQGGEIVMGRNASLEFDGKLILHHKDTINDDHHIYLSSGNSLIFQKHATIINSHPDNKLIVHNNGGYIDLSWLSYADKKKVVIIEDAQSLSTMDLIGNPVSDSKVRFELFTDESENLDYSIYSLSGQLVASGQLRTFAGNGQYEIAVNRLGEGTYVLQLDSDELEPQKFVIASE